MIDAIETRARTVALFEDTETARAAFEELVGQGFRREEISIVLTDETASTTTEWHNAVNEPHTDRGRGAVTGGVVGGTLGLAAAGVLASTGVGILAAGPILGATMGLGSGAAAGSLLGAFVGQAFARQDLDLYEKAVSDGHILLGVDVAAAAQGEELCQSLRRLGALRTDYLEGPPAPANS